MLKIPVKDMTLEERDMVSKSILFEGLYFLTNVLFEKLGSKDAFEALRPFVLMSGHAFSINMHERFQIEGTDIERIADVTQLWIMLTGNSYLQTHWGSQDVQIGHERIVRAGFINCSNIGAPKEFCKWSHELFLNGICEAINPEYECRFTQMITAGDPLCSYVIEKKK
jgi:hypothetical protein